MARRGRPPSPQAASAKVVHIKLRLYPGEDDDLIAFFDAIIPRLRAAIVKQALRSGVSETWNNDHQGHDDVLDTLDAFVT